MKQKPRLSFWQIWNMSFGFLGIQFGFALQNANVSRIFETLDAKIDDIPILWLAAPVTGLIMQPIIGHLSDNTWGKFGRRRPFFLIGAILASICLILMPHSSVLWMAAGSLWLLDASINISMEPFRAFVGDMLPNEQRTSGFAMQSFFIGIGAVVGSMLPWIMTNWLKIPNTAPKGVIPPSVQYSFFIGAVVFISAILVTVLKTKEYTPEELDSFTENQEENDIHELRSVSKRSSFLKLGGILGLIGLFILAFTYYYKLEKELFILGGILVLFFFLMLIVFFQKKKADKRNMMIDVFSDLITMPKTMKQLAVVQFFSWFALFSMWIYTVSGVTSTKYDMKIDNSFNEYLITKTSLFESQLSKKEDILKLSEIKKELERNKTKLLENKSISTSMNLANYFLDNKIYKEESLIDSFNIVVNSIQLSSIEYAEVKKELNEQKKSENPNISFKTLNFLYKNYQQNLNFLKSVDFKNYLRLKEITQNYNDGADWVGILFGVYNLFAAGFAFLLIVLARLTNRKITHAISLIVGGISLISIYFIQQPSILIVSFIGVGLVWASILSMPYAILTSALPSKKMGVYMGIFNFFIVLPQILAATILGFMVKKLFDEQAIYALIIGGLSMIIAAIMVIFVNDKYSKS